MQLDNRSLDSAVSGQPRQRLGRADKPFRIVISNPEDPRFSRDGRSISPADAPSTSRLDRWLQAITTFLSMVLKQMVADFALSAAALHPEAHCLLGDSINRDRPGANPQSNRSDEVPQEKQTPSRTKELGAAKRGKRDFHLIAPHQQRQPLIPNAIKRTNIARLEVVQEDQGHAAISRVSIFAKLRTSINRARRNRRMSAILEALDNRTLQDLGISRHEIKHVVKNGHHRNR